MAVKDRALWEELVGLTRRGQIRFNWIRGHAGHRENERCDALAVAAAEARCGLAQGKVR